ncbi:MAG: serine/threonine-protein kinase [Myxococcaceae bacterium]
MTGPLGRGGMAQILRGEHELLGRQVAIKELLPSSAKDKEALERFKREALALAGFRHQNIVTLYDLVEKNDSLFMVMELVDGPTLAELLRAGPLPADVSAVIALKLAGALEHAHFSRIVHRDLKPSNVMLSKAGEVKLMDFGIARDEGQDALTRQGVAIGTPFYMSPEQVTGGEVGPRSDLYSLGVVLYECLTGDRPFNGPSAADIFGKVRDGRHRPLSKAAPQVASTLARVVKKAMRVRTGARYLDAAEMQRDLEAYLSRAVHISHSALLLGYLRKRDVVSEAEVKNRLTSLELDIIETFGRPGRRSGGWLKWALATVAAIGTGLYLTQPHWLPLLNVLRR